jgi:hypothetical protein
MKSLETFKGACEVLGGSHDQLPASVSERIPLGLLRWFPLLRGLWWALLIGAVLLFCGQTSKFIYIDF